MSRKQFVLLTVVMVVTSFLGGAVASRIFNPREVFAEPAAKIIRANAIVLEDDNGAARVIISSSPPSISLFNDDVKGQVLLGLHDGIPTLQLRDQMNNIGVWLETSLTGSSLKLYSENTERVDLSANSAESGKLQLYDENGQGRVQLAADKDMPGLAIQDENGQPCATLWTASGLGPNLMLFNEYGAAAVGVTKNGPEMSLRDKNGKLWSAP